MSREYWDQWLAGKTKGDLFVDMLLLKEMMQRHLSTVLDIGSGDGSFIRGLGKLGFRITCVDYSQQALCYLRSISQDPTMKHMDVVCAHILSLPFFDDSFGVVTSLNVMNFFLDESEREKAFEEALRVIKPGGIFMAVVLSTEDEGRERGTPLGGGNFQLPDGKCLHYYSPSELEGLVDPLCIHKLEQFHVEDTSHDVLHTHGFIRVLGSLDEKVC